MALIDVKDLPARRLFQGARDRMREWLDGEHALTQRRAGAAFAIFPAPFAHQDEVKRFVIVFLKWTSVGSISKCFVDSDPYCAWASIGSLARCIGSDGIDPTRNADRQAFARELVDQRHQS